MKKRVLLLGMATALMTASGCARFSSTQGVDNLWRGESAPTFEKGTSTQSEVLEALGPPSQILPLNNGTAFYYLREYGEGGGFVLLLYNQGSATFNYDRAVFFFDHDGVLTDYAYSAEEAPRK